MYQYNSSRMDNGKMEKVAYEDYINSKKMLARSESHKKELLKQLEQSKAENEELKRRIDIIKTEKEELNKDLEWSVALKNDIKKELATSETHKKELKNKVFDLQGEAEKKFLMKVEFMSNLQQQKRDLEEKLEQSLAERDHLKKELEQSEALNADLKKKIDQVEVVRADFNKELKQCDAEKTKLKRELIQQKLKLEEMIISKALFKEKFEQQIEVEVESVKRELEMSKNDLITFIKQKEEEMEALRNELEVSKAENIAFKKLLNQRDLELPQQAKHKDKKVTLEQNKVDDLLTDLAEEHQSEKERLQCVNTELDQQLENGNKKNIVIEEEDDGGDDEFEVVDDAWLKI